MKTIEYRVRPVTRYIVTRYYSEILPNGTGCGGCESIGGEFDNMEQANKVAKAMSSLEPEAVCFQLADPGSTHPA